MDAAVVAATQRPNPTSDRIAFVATLPSITAVIFIERATCVGKVADPANACTMT
jgi:hypothetical protein